SGRLLWATRFDRNAGTAGRDHAAAWGPSNRYVCSRQPGRLRRISYGCALSLWGVIPLQMAEATHLGRLHPGGAILQSNGIYQERGPGRSGDRPGAAVRAGPYAQTPHLGRDAARGGTGGADLSALAG